MSGRQPSPAADLGFAAMVMAVAITDVGVREVYNRVSAEAVSLLVLGIGALSFAAAGLLLALSRRGQRFQRPARVLLVLACCVAIMGAIGKSPASVWGAGNLSRLLLLTGLATVLALVVAAMRMQAPRWQVLRRSLLCGQLLFFVSPWAVGLAMPPRIEWPASASTPALSAAPQRSAVLVLLLDELNASVAAPLVAELQRAGLATRTTRVHSIGDKTGDVVPSLFAGTVFRDARACTFTASCDGRQAIDFARIQASRPDIDVVGFFQPYCAIQGLRSCTRATIPLAFLDPGRVRCGLRRRTGMNLGVDQAWCDEVYVRSWGNMADATVKAALDAPALRQGGLLFAHLPLPHPPGEHGVGTLQDHYRANLLRAADMLRNMLATARKAGLPVQVLIFSDHPLRQAHWCRSFAPYTLGGCRISPELEDAFVPIIAAGREPPDLAGLDSNLGVFGLIARLR